MPIIRNGNNLAVLVNKGKDYVAETPWGEVVVRGAEGAETEQFYAALQYAATDLMMGLVEATSRDFDEDN